MTPMELAGSASTSPPGPCRSPTGPPPGHTGDGPLKSAWIEDLEEGPDGLRPRFDADVMEAVISAVAQTSRWPEWEKLTAPTLAVFADNGMFTEEQKTELIRRRPGTRRVDLPGAGHDAHLDAFDRWIHVLRAYLTEQR